MSVLKGYVSPANAIMKLQSVWVDSGDSRHWKKSVDPHQNSKGKREEQTNVQLK